MDGKRILTLLGLALRGGNLVLGEDMVGDALRDHRARVVLLAADASERTRSQAERSARNAGRLCVTLPFPKEDLGRALGRAQTALAAVTDIGLASAVLDRLAEGDPARYGEAAELMARKAQRTLERRAEKKARLKEDRGTRPPRRDGPPEKRAPHPAKRDLPPERASGRGPGAPERRAPRPAKGDLPPERASGRGPGAPERRAPYPAKRDLPPERASGRGPGAPERRAPRPAKGDLPPERASGRGSGAPAGRAPHPAKTKRPSERPFGGGPRSRGPRSGGPRPKPRANPYAHSRPVKKGKGSFRDREK